MADEARLAVAFTLAFALTCAAVPLAIGIAVRTDFHDVPVGYKGHPHATPYLGGVALLTGFVPAALWLGDALGELAPIVGCALVLLIVGTVDDRRHVRPGLRILAEIAAAVVLFTVDLGFSAVGNTTADLALTIVFLVGVVNAYNIFDNIDGATGTVGVVSAGTVGVLCAIEGNAALGALSLALAGSCAGFLPWNLSRPARIFLGDGGSMPIGFVLAAAIMSVPGTGGLGWAIVPVALVLVGLPALDTSLVIVSRLRRGARVYLGARDHLTHRLLQRLGSARRVAGVLAVSQAVLVLSGAALSQAADEPALVGAVAIIVGGFALVAALEWPRRAPLAETLVDS